jgi:hypothetical protein
MRIRKVVATSMAAAAVTLAAALAGGPAFAQTSLWGSITRSDVTCEVLPGEIIPQ